MHTEHIENEVAEKGRPKISLQRTSIYGRWTWNKKKPIVPSVIGRLSRRNLDSPMWYQKVIDTKPAEASETNFKMVSTSQPVPKHGTRWRMPATVVWHEKYTYQICSRSHTVHLDGKSTIIKMDNDSRTLLGTISYTVRYSTIGETKGNDGSETLTIKGTITLPHKIIPLRDRYLIHN